MVLRTAYGPSKKAPLDCFNKAAAHRSWKQCYGILSMATRYCELAPCLVPLNTWNAAKIYRAKGMDLSRGVNLRWSMMALNGITPQEPIRILVADDSDIMRHSLRRLLESQDHWQVCEEACNGREAVEKVQRNAPERPSTGFRNA